MDRTTLNSAVIVIQPAQSLLSDPYPLVSSRTGAAALAHLNARVLDSGADGQPGGDFTAEFQVTPEATQ